MIKTFIINLDTSTTRREYMQNLLSPYKFLDVQFIKAINGNTMHDDELNKVFDDKKSLQRYGRTLNKGEKGCALSHRICYETLIKSDNDYALIFEDDIAIIRDLNELGSLDLNSILSKKPTIMFLSGDFWYFKRTQPIINVYSAIGAYAYIINKAAAKLMLTRDKYFGVSDDWMLYKNLGIRYKAIIPYLIDANLNMDTLGSDVNQYSWGINRKKMSWSNILHSYRTGIIKRILKATGHFESKIKVRDGQIVPGLR